MAHRLHTLGFELGKLELHPGITVEHVMEALGMHQLYVSACSTDPNSPDPHPLPAGKVPISKADADRGLERKSIVRGAKASA